MFKIIPPVKQYPLSEIPQQFDGVFSFAIVNGEEVQQVHEMVKCRDFLGDIVWNNVHNRPTSIYGFVADDTRKIDKTKLCWLFKGKPETINNLIHNVEMIIHPIEKLNKLRRKTKITPLLAHPGYVLIEADKFWQSTLWLLSFYGFLVKVSGQKWEKDWQTEIFDTQSNENTYFKQVSGVWNQFVNNIKNVAKLGKGSVTGYTKEENLSINKIHNETGFVSILRLVQYKKANENLYAAAWEKVLK